MWCVAAIVNRSSQSLTGWILFFFSLSFSFSFHSFCSFVRSLHIFAQFHPFVWCNALRIHLGLFRVLYVNYLLFYLLLLSFFNSLSVLFQFYLFLCTAGTPSNGVYFRRFPSDRFFELECDWMGIRCYLFFGRKMEKCL